MFFKSVNFRHIQCKVCQNVATLLNSYRYRMAYGICVFALTLPLHKLKYCFLWEDFHIFFIFFWIYSIWSSLLAGLAEEDLLPCVDWMSPFWDVLKEEVPEYDKKFSKLLPGFTKSNVVEDSHNLQKHDISLTMMVSVVNYKKYK